MTKVAVVYHSGYGHTARQAAAVVAGAQSVAGVEAKLISVEEFEAQTDWVNAADAIIFGAPTYMGSVSGQFKVFMDATSKIWYGRGWQNKIAAGFTNSASPSGDKLGSLIQLATFAAQHGMIWVGVNLLPGGNSSTSAPDAPNRLGGFLGALAQSNADQGPDVAPPQADLTTAEHLGQRVAEAAKRWNGKAV